MKKKEILFCLDTLNCGGIETSAVSFLQSLDSGRFSVTLCLDRPGGDLLPRIPRWVEVQVLPYGPLERMEMDRGRKAVVRHLISHGRFGVAFRWLRFGLTLLPMTPDQLELATRRRRYRTLKPDTKEYDLAICYSELLQILYVADFVNARHRAVWMHTELSPLWSDVRTYLPCFRKMDSIFCVSPSLVESYRSALPECADRIREFRHRVDIPQILARAEEAVSWPKGANGLRILSVGRLERQKGFDLIPEIASALKRKGRTFFWLVVGEGRERENLRTLVGRWKVGDCVAFAGKKLNPYPYYKSCDLYVQPSRYEGYCLTVAEARVFRKPIVATDFNGAREQLKDGEAGMVVPCEAEALVQAIDSLLVDKALRARLAAHSNSDFGSENLNDLVLELCRG